MTTVVTPVKRALVTGASSGIGQAIANRLLGDGWAVAGVDRAYASISHEHYQHHQLDLADLQACAQFASEVVQTHCPNAVVHAAGYMTTANLGALDSDEAQAMWKVHAGAAIELANAMLPSMAKAKNGRLVLIGSRVSAGVAGRSLYGAAKAALPTLARSWAAEVVSHGVTVNVVSPAATDTPMLHDSARGSSAPKTPPIGRFIEPREVAGVVAFLLSEEAAAITGQTISICGGASL